MSIETAQEPRIVPATDDDLPFIRATVERLRLDAERLEPEQFITLRRGDSIIGFGRIKPYSETYELASLAVVEEERGRGWGRLIVHELIRRFPQDEVYITTDIPELLRADGLPAHGNLAAGAER